MHPVSRTTRNLLAACQSRAAAVASCLLLLLTSLDPQTLAQTCWGQVFAAPANVPGSPDDTDEMLDTAALARPSLHARRHHSPMGGVPLAAAPSVPPRAPTGLCLPAAPACAHDLRNGLGSPLLC